MYLKCNRCKQELPVKLIPKIIPIQNVVFKNQNDPRNPKYNVMIKAICEKCGRFIKFIKQNQQVIDETNKALELFYENTIDNN